MKKFVLITGASGGIGGGIARHLALNGYSLYLHYYSNREAIEKLLEELTSVSNDNEYIPIQADLRTEEGITKLCQEIYQVDGIIHNSGTTVNNVLTNMQMTDIHNLISLHLTAPIVITKTLLPKLIQRKTGSIIFISSIWGQTGASCETVYSGVKGGQISFAKALSKEVALSNIRVNVVSPGAIKTNMMREYTEEELADIINEIPLGRLGTPKDIAEAVLYLLSEKSSYITGHVLSVNGGWYM
ncbi:SDR family oxidoreductase [Caldibacillus lycopersici]|uniref:SDR family oxidoreductase n=1 Tax=Perspicuibacillus lycopersici TaxID=1325689 RepID=A0AAE3LP69_9BACI|nr:SDR family oxidoreductase [Perspicuibacillus lycopersici]MCU9612039.1 SDR family oxidoreductase [Perspicuibacillus lycopersici]